MQIAILGNPDSWYVRDLRRAAADRHDLVALPFSGIRACLGGAPEIAIGDCELTSFDAVLVRTMPPGSLEQVVFRMDALARLEAAGSLVVNPPKAIEVAVDKYLASARLQAAGLSTPKTVICQTTDDAMAAFQRLGGDVVLKPLFGSEGRGIARVTDEALALRAFKMLEQLGAVLYVQQFIPHPGYDVRLFVLGQRVWGMKRRNPLDWRTNVSRGATTEPLEVDDRLAEIARRATDATGAWMAGVDLLPAIDGREFVLEVNAVPGWRALARTLRIDVASELLQELEKSVCR